MRWAIQRHDDQPWQATARQLLQRAGLDPRTLRRFRWIHKAGAVRRSHAHVFGQLRFVLTDPETDNFTYEIANLDELAQWVSEVTGCELTRAREVVAEPDNDAELRARLMRVTERRRLWSKRLPPFGKRLGWYAVARVLRPQVTVEVGIHDGLGSALLLRALERNANGGRLVSFDVNSRAGWLVGSHPQWEARYESSETGLPKLLSEIGTLDLFIYDALHAYEPERRDLELAADALAPDGILLSDDAQVSRALAPLCRERDLDYFEFHEAPRGHFYPGSALGAGRRRT